MRLERRSTVYATFFLAVALVVAMSVSCFAGSSQEVRQPGVAGGFYPADPKTLTSMMDDMLARASVSPINDPILAVVAPHAGYQFSGPVAAYTYAVLKGHKFSRVVVIAPSHFEAFDFTSIYDGDAYATPLGTVQVDKAFAAQLAKMSATIQLSGRGHLPTQEGTEHALEVQLPWLQRVLGNFSLVPVVMGDQSYGNSRALGVALAKLIHGGDTLIVASSDLSHYHPYDDAVKIDHKTLNALQIWDYFSMSQNFQERVWEACGGAPVVAAMIAAEHMGANRALLLKYANTGDVTGDRSRVVGYGSAVLVKTDATKIVAPAFSVAAKDKKELLQLARKSVEYAVREKKVYQPPVTSNELFNQDYGAFVTLKKSGEFRGCIGYMSATKPLYLAVRDTATLAAMRDPRVPAVSESELSQLTYEISVLSPLRRVQDVRQIKVGEHGLLMRNADRQGVLLPQVPVEQRWDRSRFLDETCLKASMQAGCWKDENTDIFSFTAVIFGDAFPNALMPEPSAIPGLPGRPGAPAPGSPPH